MFRLLHYQPLPFPSGYGSQCAKALFRTEVPACAARAKPGRGKDPIPGMMTRAWHMHGFSVEPHCVCFSYSVFPGSIWSLTDSASALSCFEAGDQKDRAGSGGAFWVAVPQGPDQQCHCSGVKKQSVGVDRVEVICSGHSSCSWLLRSLQ